MVMYSEWGQIWTIIFCRSVGIINNHQTLLGPAIIIFSQLSSIFLIGGACALKITRLHSVSTGLWGWAWRRSLDGVVMFLRFWLVWERYHVNIVTHTTSTLGSSNKKGASFMLLQYIWLIQLTLYSDTKMNAGMHISGVMTSRVPSVVPQVPSVCPCTTRERVCTRSYNIVSWGTGNNQKA